MAEILKERNRSDNIMFPSSKNTTGWKELTTEQYYA
jgi:hypothetical protein